LPGNWFVPTNADASRTVLYFHGGGYAFYAAAHRDLIRHVAVATRARTFALDYRLAPEHRYPAQLDDAFAAYRALLHSGHQPSQLVLAGDSAGGHLMLSLLKKLRDVGMPLPALGIGLCPWTAVGDRAAGVFRNDRFDWVSGAMTLQFSQWAFGADCGPENADVSPGAFDIAGFPPLYLQAGGREALADMIHRFARHVATSDGTVTLDVWPDMTHDFQAYGDLLAESAEALCRIGLAVDHYLGASRLEPLARSARTVPNPPSYHPSI
jgi:acetyl esterase/lipase